jgi:predicted amidophosphoribosyltransferase
MFQQVFAPVIDLVYPPRCPTCGQGIAQHGALCQDCWSKLVIPGEPHCGLCQRPGASHGAVCGFCQEHPPRHAGISAATLYNDGARALVLAFKHGHRIALAGLLSRLMLARLPVLEGEWLVVPVPLHRRRLWQRGFNQSALLAREIATARHHVLMVDGLLRTRSTPPLGELGRRERARVLNGAIAANPRRAGRIGAAKVRIACFSRVLDEAL